MTGFSMDQQLTLDVRLRDTCSLENFLPDSNRELVKIVQRIAEGDTDTRMLCVWGPEGSGKTHLLQAACRRVHERENPAVYIPLRDHAQLSPEVLEGLARCMLVCLDDIDAIAGSQEWERAIMVLYEELGESTVLVVAARNNAQSCGLVLADLATRLASGLAYSLAPLDDEGKLKAVKARAKARGLDLADEVGRYVLNRFPRDTHALFALLDRLDKGSLAEQRRITIPFIKSLENERAE